MYEEFGKGFQTKKSELRVRFHGGAHVLLLGRTRGATSGSVHDVGRVVSFIDFGNVNHWFETDRQDHLNHALAPNQKLGINLRNLKDFSDIISGDSRFYYDHDGVNQGSLDFIRVARDVFGKHRVITKQMQMIRRHLSQNELSATTRQTRVDGVGRYIKIPKCNFDVEISVDAMRLMERYDTFCLFSSDADFIRLIRHLKSCGKKIVLVKGGHVVHQLKEAADVVINAQNIKEYVAVIKQKPGV